MFTRKDGSPLHRDRKRGSKAFPKHKGPQRDVLPNGFKGLPEIAPKGLMRIGAQLDANLKEMQERGKEIRFQTIGVFLPLLPFRRYKGARGGRGGAKSHHFAQQTVKASIVRHTRQACLREVQNSIKDSVKQLIEDKIAKFDLAPLFHVTEQEIVGPNDSLMIFRGLRKQTAGNIKSLEGFTDAWYEEAQTLSQRSLDLATPTFRTNSQQSFSWNPYLPDDPVDKFFEDNYYIDGHEDFICVHATYEDNPFFPDELRRDMERDQKRDPERYDHIWNGGYLKNAEARVFKNWRVESFDTPARADFLHGADWGYSIDPTVLVRGFVGRWEFGKAIPDATGRTLFIDRECYKIGVELDHTPQLFDTLVPGFFGAAREWPIIADSSNPQAISYLKRHHYPNIKAAVKGPNSIKEGVTFLQSYDIVVHPRCSHTRDELTHFVYKTDPHTQLILPVLDDKKNHVIDSLRYMVEPLRRPRRHTIVGSY